MVKLKYRVRVEGSRVVINIENQVRTLGFFATRYVEAMDENSAAEITLVLIRNELKNRILNTASDPPLITATKTEELTSFGKNMVPGAGFSWFPE